jgi:hypothetical protein
VGVQRHISVYNASFWTASDRIVSFGLSYQRMSLDLGRFLVLGRRRRLGSRRRSRISIQFAIWRRRRRRPAPDKGIDTTLERESEGGMGKRSTEKRRS